MLRFPLCYREDQPEKLGNGWKDTISRHRPAIIGTSTAAALEEAVTRLLEELKTSHVGFFHGSARRASSRAALSATYLADDTDEGRRWIFQDVHPGGAASLAAIEPGDILLRVGGEETIPPTHPTFAMGETTELTVLTADGEVRTRSVTVARPKGKKLHFPGMVSVEVANEISRQVEELGNIGHLMAMLGHAPPFVVLATRMASSSGLRARSYFLCATNPAPYILAYRTLAAGSPRYLAIRYSLMTFR